MNEAKHDIEKHGNVVVIKLPLDALLEMTCNDLLYKGKSIRNKNVNYAIPYGVHVIDSILYIGNFDETKAGYYVCNISNNYDLVFYLTLGKN